MAKTGSGNSRGDTIRYGLDSGILAMKYLHDYNSALLFNPSPIDIKDFVVNYLHLVLIKTAIDLPYIKAFIVYGQMIYSVAATNCLVAVNPGTVLLNENIVSNSPEWRFILAHEAGHWIINTDRTPHTLSCYTCCKSFADRTDFLDTDRMAHYYDTVPDACSEIKADCVANALLMPPTAFLLYSKQLMDQFGFYDHVIIAGKHPQEESSVISKLASAFIVPEYAVRNHLYTFGMYTKC